MRCPLTAVTTSPGARSTPLQNSGGRSATIVQPTNAPFSSAGSTSTSPRKLPKPASITATTSFLASVSFGGAGGGALATGRGAGAATTGAFEPPQAVAPSKATRASEKSLTLRLWAGAPAPGKLWTWRACDGSAGAQRRKRLLHRKK